MRSEISTVLTFGFSIGVQFLEVSVKISCQPSDLHKARREKNEKDKHLLLQTFHWRTVESLAQRNGTKLSLT